MTESMSMKPPVYGMPGMIDWPKKLSNQCSVNTKMIRSSKEIFLSIMLAPTGEEQEPSQMAVLS